MQVFGADGLLQRHPLARHLAGAKMAHYLDGSTEVQNLLISKALFD
jgi:alkylation response protein AidB-like acyl-CoA dehydrogenase